MAGDIVSAVKPCCTWANLIIIKPEICEEKLKEDIVLKMTHCPNRRADILLGTLANFFIFSSIQRLGAPTASIFEIAYPFFVAIFTLALFGGDLNLFFWIGGLLMFLGGVIIIRFG